MDWKERIFIEGIILLIIFIAGVQVGLRVTRTEVNTLKGRIECLESMKMTDDGDVSIIYKKGR